MGKRIVFGTLVVAFLLLLPSAAFAAQPGEPPGQANKTDEATAPGNWGNGNGNAWGPGGQGKSNAPNNASKGMNRPGAPGGWKDNGHVPSPNSAPQGYSPSDPDFTGNNGVDKPGQSGGFSDDKDGNNGCGNDDDAEDDNNGWCGNKPEPPSPPPPPPSPPGGPGPVVLPGPKITPPVVGGEKLPVTGVDVFVLMWMGTGMTLSGQALRKRNRRAR